MGAGAGDRLFLGALMPTTATAHSFSQREKVPAKRADEGLPDPTSSASNPSPVAFGDTRSLWERGGTTT
jgi:hypothetical protein